MSKTRRRPDLVRTAGRCKLAVWIDNKQADDGRKYQTFRLGLTKSEFYQEQWHETTAYFYPEDIQNIETLLQDFRLNHTVGCPTGTDSDNEQGR